MLRAAFRIVTIAIVLLVLPLDAADAATVATNKTVVAADGTLVINATTGADDVPLDVTLLSETVKTSGSSSLLIQFTAECFIASFDLDSHIPYDGYLLDERLAAVRVWVEIDGKPLPVGAVNFCIQGVFQFELAQPPNLVLASDLEAFGGAYGFNFPALNVSSGTHLVEVKARLIANIVGWDDVPNDGLAAIIGSRTLIVDPIKVRKSETF
jgi:hypothetical protein